MLVFCSATRKLTPSPAVEARDDLEDLLDQLRRQAHRRLVEQDQCSAAPSAPGRSPPSAARRPRCSRRGGAAVLEPREIVVDPSRSSAIGARLPPSCRRRSAGSPRPSDGRSSVAPPSPGSRRAARIVGVSPSMRSPRHRIVPLVTSPRSARSRLEIAFRVVVLPAPLAPSSATMPPSGTATTRPSAPRMTWL